MAFLPSVAVRAMPRAVRKLNCMRKRLNVAANRKIDFEESLSDGKVAGTPGRTKNEPRKASNSSASNGTSIINKSKKRQNEKEYPSGRLPFALELDFVLNHPIADGVIAALVTLNCLIFALQTIDVSPSLRQAFQSYEHNLSLVFLIEYFGRWYGKGLSPQFLLSRGMIIDFMAVAPIGFAVTDQSEALFVRILRLSRILRIQRVVMDTDRSAEVMDSMSSVQVRLASIGLSLFSLLYVSAGLFFQVEKDVNPNVVNFFDAFYFSTVTLFTVGFGDVTPLTTLGRAITVLTVLSGAVLVPYQLSQIERVRELTKTGRSPRLDGKTLENTDRSTAAPLSSEKSLFMAVSDQDIECKQCFLRGHQRDARFCRNCGKLLLKRRFD